MIAINRNLSKVGFSRSTTAKLQQIRPGVELVTWNTVEALAILRSEKELWLLDAGQGDEVWMNDRKQSNLTHATF